MTTLGITPNYITNCFGLSILFYFKNNKIYAKRSMDYCQTWLEAEYVVIESTYNPTDAGIASTFSNDESQIVILQFINTSGAIITATSTNNGLTFTVLP